MTDGSPFRRCIINELSVKIIWNLLTSSFYEIFKAEEGRGRGGGAMFYNIPVKAASHGRLQYYEKYIIFQPMGKLPS